jgi:hypothetical protein
MDIFGSVTGRRTDTVIGVDSNGQMLTAGTKAPSFTLPNHTGDTIRVDPGEARRPMALLFYPESGKYNSSISCLPQ